MSKSQGKKPSRVDAAYHAAVDAAGRLGKNEFAKVWGEVPPGPHVRSIGDVELEISYRGPRSELDNGTLQPMYRVVLRFERLRHKLSVAAPTEWFDKKVDPNSPEAIDAIAGGAMRLTIEETPPKITARLKEATARARKGNGDYDVKRPS
jgi:hypothetical protein